ncbi:GntR family transcriptional regulator [Paracraurococcus ruber]|uniref:GntR family transcriptional regulator n=1 Tax=Paracraurococcus ruber TaxID=77675 RepID=A0ABS1CYB9_9PROT|nr:GntR family transcriptional regulator [Paracraurococcus ruber]MBK1659531.1 GntR family transcriptional regulator [Paracraurococcus ruber]TDG30406.1 GntR family transcriptional regulator [Paracraurococcus ruber]
MDARVTSLPATAGLAAGLAALAPLGPRRSAAGIAYDALRQAVIGLALPPGTILSRADLAARLGVSQTPVREALIRLQEEGLIEVVPHASTRVARIDLASAREASFLRLSIELEAVRRLAADPAPALAAALRAEIARMRELHAQGQQEAVAAADEEFHARLLTAAGVPGLVDLIRSRSGHLDRLRRLHLPAPGKAERILAEHAAVAEAIIARDPAAAEQALRRHLSHTLAELDRIRGATPEYF